MESPRERKPTAAADFGAATKVIELPVPGPGGRSLCVEIEAAAPEELIELLGALFAMGRDQARAGAETPEEQLRFLNEQSEKARAAVTRYVRSPRISFDGAAEGAVEWRRLHLQNRIAIIRAIADFSRDGSIEEVERFSTFPAIDGGGRSGGGGDGPAPAPGGAAGGAGAESA